MELHINSSVSTATEQLNQPIKLVNFENTYESTFIRKKIAF